MPDRLTDERYKPRIRLVDEQGYTEIETDLLASAIVLKQENGELREEVKRLKKRNQELENATDILGRMVAAENEDA